MILTYNEGLAKAMNPDWFKATYKPLDLASDEEVKQINDLVKELGEEVLFDYFQIRDDMILQKEYVDDLLDYLYEIKDEKH